MKEKASFFEQPIDLPTNMVCKHIRANVKNNKGGATIICDVDRKVCAIAICAPGDAFNKKQGRALAVRRLQASLRRPVKFVVPIDIVDAAVDELITQSLVRNNVIRIIKSAIHKH